MLRNIENSDLEGKTIKAIDSSCVNVIHITFSDNTKLSIWAEVYGPIPVIQVDDKVQTDLG